MNDDERRQPSIGTRPRDVPPANSGLFARLHAHGDILLEGQWKLIGSPTSITPHGFIDLNTGDFVPVTAVVVAQRAR